MLLKMELKHSELVCKYVLDMLMEEDQFVVNIMEWNEEELKN